MIKPKIVDLVFGIYIVGPNSLLHLDGNHKLIRYVTDLKYIINTLFLDRLQCSTMMLKKNLELSERKIFSLFINGIFVWLTRTVNHAIS